MPRISILLAQFPGGNVTHPDVSDWVREVSLFCQKDPRIERLEHWRVSTTPITMARNRAVLEAKKRKVDYLLMVDSDMRPDYCASKPFFSTTLDFIFQNMLSTPCVIAVPYCGPPPVENVYAFKIATNETGQPNLQFKLDQFTREEAANRSGFERVGAIATGICIIDMRVFDRLKPPHFYYEYTDQNQAELASTEDVTFSRDCAFARIPVYLNWDAWAGHHKLKCVPRPHIMTVDDVADGLIHAIETGHRKNEKTIVLEPKRD